MRDEIAPVELKKLLDGGATCLLLDVRQPEEFDLVNIPGAKLIPLGELQQRTDEVEQLISAVSGPIVVYCRSGGRSAMAAQWLKSLPSVTDKSTEVLNLRGGINAYAVEADSRLTPY